MASRATRREFIKRAAAGAGAVAVAGTGVATAAASDGEQTLHPGAVYPDPNQPWGDPYKEPRGGRLARVVDKQTIELTSAGENRTIRVRPDASVFTDRPATINDFRSGELLAVEGVDGANGFEATAIWAATTPLWTRINRRRGTILDTADGPIRVTEYTKIRPWIGPEAAVGLSELRAGTAIVLQVRDVPGEGRFANTVKVLDR